MHIIIMMMMTTTMMICMCIYIYICRHLRSMCRYDPTNPGLTIQSSKVSKVSTSQISPTNGPETMDQWATVPLTTQSNYYQLLSITINDYILSDIFPKQT